MTFQLYADMWKTFGKLLVAPELLAGDACFRWFDMMEKFITGLHGQRLQLGAVKAFMKR